ncbi:SatD family protein [Mucilaginibacter sp. BJC16-A38]|uniref:SatD family protein n=1 Tax=Mucilaginibacter phenanthrenivorans TaxID=1234842 RepID=UPI00215704AA|nr:SatD family protein [Mucilaginibacter phenanthrenivorans]MCR8558350.1 SatD family protein [Mucilaginibacter phenanthrenivorans]
MMDMKYYAVITGDIINFTRLDNDKRQRIIASTEKLLKSWVDKPTDAEVFRGDSYQFIMDDVEDAIKKSIQLICWFKKQPENNNKINLSSRVSVGIGGIAYKGKSVLDSDGEAFHQSGRSFDKMGADEILTIKTTNEEINQQLTIILSFINLFVNQWKANQAEVVYLACEGYTQTKMAEALGIKQGAVNNRLKVAKWKEVEKGINYISKLVTK